eukprot:5720539-Pyramimonas_sp.AAC.1
MARGPRVRRRRQGAPPGLAAHVFEGAREQAATDAVFSDLSKEDWTFFVALGDVAARMAQRSGV